MKSVLLFLTVILSFQAGAQHFSAGARTGYGFWEGTAMNTWTYQNELKKNTLWEKEVFVRYETEKHIAFEVGFSSMASEDTGNIYLICGTGLPAEYSFISSQVNTNEFHGMNLRVQYSLGQEQVRGLRNYIGAVITPTMHTRTSTNIVYHSVDNSYTRETAYTNREAGLQAGIEDMIKYRIGRHIDVHVLGGCKVNFSGNELRRAWQLQGGVAYVF